MSMPRIQMYTTATCGYCHAAKAVLRREHLPFEEIDLTMDERGRAALVRRTGGQSFPQILVDGRPIGGFKELVQTLHAGGLDAAELRAA